MFAFGIFHDKSQEANYTDLLEAVKTQLKKLAVKLKVPYRDPNVFGTDEDLATRNSIANVFPNSHTMYCVKHLKDNLKRKESSFINLKPKSNDTKNWLSFSKKLFTNGVSGETTNHTFSNKGFVDIGNFESEAKDFSDMCGNKGYPEWKKPLARTLDKLQSNFVAILKFPDMSLSAWTNNLSEAMNSSLKKRFSYETKSILEAVTLLSTAIVAQEGHMNNAICRKGGKWKINTALEKHRDQYHAVIQGHDDATGEALRNKFTHLLPRFKDGFNLDRGTNRIITKSTCQGKKINERKHAQRREPRNTIVENERGFH